MNIMKIKFSSFIIYDLTDNVQILENFERHCYFNIFIIQGLYNYKEYFSQVPYELYIVRFIIPFYLPELKLFGCNVLSG